MDPSAYSMPFNVPSAFSQEASGSNDAKVEPGVPMRHRDTTRSKGRKDNQEDSVHTEESTTGQTDKVRKTIAKKEPQAVGSRTRMSPAERRIKNRASVQQCRKRKKDRVESLAQEDSAVKKEHPILYGLLDDVTALFEEYFIIGFLSRENFPELDYITERNPNSMPGSCAS